MQGMWLSNAYYLEFEGENTFSAIWLASLAFFGANVWILVQFIRHHNTRATTRSATATTVNPADKRRR
jgi:phosphatidylinositol glycan class M